ncbi:hypothetical protein STTU_0337 [Streptomyces sp. Tu6071]|nr:hypothetical protein STTU_0337 [Streptomyces sp. Tu6071]
MRRSALWPACERGLRGSSSSGGEDPVQAACLRLVDGVGELGGAHLVRGPAP